MKFLYRVFCNAFWMTNDKLFWTETTSANTDIQVWAFQSPEFSSTWDFQEKGPLLKYCFFIKNIFLEQRLVCHHGCAEVHYCTRVIVPVPANTAVLNSPYKDELWWPRQRDILQPDTTWWIVPLPGLILLVLRIGCDIYQKLWPSTKVVCLSGQLVYRSVSFEGKGGAASNKMNILLRFLTVTAAL